MKPGLEDKMRELVMGESASAALEEWSQFLSDLEVVPYNYRGDHVAEAVDVAKQLAQETSADLDIVVMATWLHDCANPNTAGTPLPTGITHCEACASKAREFLVGEGVDAPTVKRVCDAIRKHGGYALEKPLEPIEAQIVWEADKLTKVGLTSVIRQIINGVRYEPNPSMKGILQRVHKLMPLCRKIAASVMTEPGKRMATKRLRNNEDFITRLEKELYFLE